MEIANVVLRLLSVSQVLLFMGMLLLSANPFRVRALGVALMVGILSYLIAPIYLSYVGQASTLLLWYPASVVPCILVLFVWVLFEEQDPIPLWLMCFVLISMAFALLAHLSYIGVLAVPELKLLAHFLKMIAVILALYIVWRGREADLVELRIKFRSLFVLVVAAIVLGVIVVELATGFVVPQKIEIPGMAIIFLSTLVFNMYFVRKNPSTRLVGVPRRPQNDSDDEVIKTLLSRMQSERLYADHSVRVAGLADTLGVPEYQLRKRINQQLGYRNFNQFINRYRIEEAGVRLLENHKTPVLTIALDVGFRSISSFNTAFHTQFGVSPTQYRAESELTA